MHILSAICKKQKPIMGYNYICKEVPKCTRANFACLYIHPGTYVEQTSESEKGAFLPSRIEPGMLMEEQSSLMLVLRLEVNWSSEFTKTRHTWKLLWGAKGGWGCFCQLLTGKREERKQGQPCSLSPSTFLVSCLPSPYLQLYSTFPLQPLSGQ